LTPAVRGVVALHDFAAREFAAAHRAGYSIAGGAAPWCRRICDDLQPHAAVQREQQGSGITIALIEGDIGAGRHQHVSFGVRPRHVVVQPDASRRLHDPAPSSA
jgi:hypothetical protein